jgi:hypothetical protein
MKAEINSNGLKIEEKFTKMEERIEEIKTRKNSRSSNPSRHDELLERSDAQIMGGSRSQDDTEKLLNVEEVEKYDDKDWMQKWGSCDEEVLIEEEEEGRNFMQRNLDTPRVREGHSGDR